jgi:hypothetical protein
VTIGGVGVIVLFSALLLLTLKTFISLQFVPTCQRVLTVVVGSLYNEIIV